MGNLLRWTAISACMFSLAGCRHTPPVPDWRYEIRPEIFVEGPPRPVGQGIKTADHSTTHTEIKIDPRTARGYENIPENVKTLYGPKPLDISQNEVIRETLAHNRDIKIQNYFLQVAEAQVPLSKGIYDLLLEAQAEAIKDQTASVTSLTAAGVRRRQDLQASATQLLPTGARAQFAYAYTRLNQKFQFSAINPAITHGLALSISQPLLRGFGPTITNIDIALAQIDRKTSAADFEALVQDQVRTALTLYWNLVFAVRSFDVQVIAYNAALDLLRVNRAKAEAGVMAPTEVLQAQAQAEARRENIITVRQLVRDAEDRLKQLMFFKDESPAWDLELRPVQELSWREMELDPGRVLAEALENRPEIRSRLSRLERSGVEIVRAKDGLRPKLDLSVTGQITGVGQRHSDAIEILEQTESNKTSIGLDFSIPLQNRQARYNYLQRRIDRKRTTEELERERDTVAFEVRQAVRDLRTNRERIEVTRARVESEHANLDAQLKRYDVGVSTAFEVLQFQENLSKAQEAHIRAVVDYNRAMIALERARGTILKTYGITVQSPDLNPQPEKIGFPVGLN